MDLSMCGEPADFLEVHSGKLALNVKHHKQLAVSSATLARLKKLATRTADRLLMFAEEALRETWWSTMEHRARELFVGGISSEGRQGGWLVFKLTKQQLEELVEEAEAECDHCGKPYAAHIDKKCPFDSSNWAAATNAPLITWEALKLFSGEVKETLATIGDGFEEEVIFQLEHYLADNPEDSVGVPTTTSEAKAAADAASAFAEDDDDEG